MYYICLTWVSCEPDSFPRRLFILWTNQRKDEIWGLGLRREWILIYFFWQSKSVFEIPWILVSQHATSEGFILRQVYFLNPGFAACDIIRIHFKSSVFLIISFWNFSSVRPLLRELGQWNFPILKPHAPWSWAIPFRICSLLRELGHIVFSPFNLTLASWTWAAYYFYPFNEVSSGNIYTL